MGLPMWIGHNVLLRGITRHYPKGAGNPLNRCAWEDAEVISSEVGNETDVHIPVLDLDFDAELIPSTTTGHHHLYLHKPMSWQAYVKLLKALAEAGIVEQGYANASIARGYSCVRLPWVKKEKE